MRRSRNAVRENLSAGRHPDDGAVIEMEALEIGRVPRIKHAGPALPRASGDYGVVNNAAAEALPGNFDEHFAIFLTVQAHKRRSLLEALDEKDGLVGGNPRPNRQPG